MWLLAWGGEHFANLFGNAEFNNVKANLFLDKVVFEQDLSSISVNTRVKAQSEVVATFDLRPMNAGYFFCPLPFGGQVRFDVSVPMQPIALSATLTGTKQENGELILALESTEQKVTAFTSAPPITSLIAQNPN